MTLTATKYKESGVQQQRWSFVLCHSQLLASLLLLLQLACYPSGLNATTPAREERRVKVEPRVETAMKIAQHLRGSLERSIGGLSSQVGELVAALKPDGQQAERLMKVEGKLSTAEGALVKIE